MMALAAPVLAVLAAPPGEEDTGRGPEWGKAAPIALLIIVLLGISLVFLIRSMNHQMKKVPPSFDPPAGTDPTPDADGQPGHGGGSQLDGAGADVSGADAPPGDRSPNA